MPLLEICFSVKMYLCFDYRVSSAALRQFLMLTDSAFVLEKMELLGAWTQLLDSEQYITAITDVARY